MANKSRIAEAYVQLIPSMDGFAKGIDKDLAKTSKLGTNVGKSIGGNLKTGILGGLGGLAAGIGGLLAAAGVGQFLNNTIQSAAQLQDVTAAAGTVFGAEAKKLEEWAGGAAKAFGATKEQALNAALTFGTFGKAAGLTGGNLSTFSTDLSQLAGDLASFRGTSTEDAITAVGAALRGEYEPIRAYGVLLDEAALKQEALALGIYDGNGALNQQQKVLAAQSAIFKQTTDAQGDFARTSDSAANTQKTFTSELANLKAEIGTQLLPIFTSFLQVLSQSLPTIRDALLPAVANLAKEFEKALPNIIGFIKAFLEGKTPLNDFFNIIGGIFGFIRDNLQAITIFAGIVTGLVAAFKIGSVAMTAYNVAMGIYAAVTGTAAAATTGAAAATTAFSAALAATGIGAIVIAVGLLIAGFVYLATQTTFFQDTWANLTKFMGEAWNNVVSFFRDSLANIGKFFTTVFGFIGNAFKGYINFWIGLFEGFINFFINGINFLLKGINAGLGFLGKAIGIELKVGLIPTVKLPRLATGANIAGSSTGTPVIVGDKNKAETVTDLGLTNRFIAETLNLVRNVDTGTTQPPIVNLTVNPSEGMSETELANKVVKQLRREMRR